MRLLHLALLSAFIASAGSQALAAATPVNIADPTTARVARVEPGSRVAVQEVNPTTFFHSATLALTSNKGCSTIAAPPAGKALIVRQVRVDVFNDPSPGVSENVEIFSSADCSGSPIGDVNPATVGHTTVAFDPGFAVSEASSLSAKANLSVEAEVYVDGYTVTPAVAPVAGQTIQVRGTHRQP